MVQANPQSRDKRWRMVEAAMRRNSRRKDKLTETLRSIQDAFGYLEPEGLRYVAESLHIPLSRAYRAAAVPGLFRPKPPGRHTCVVCTGPKCQSKGAPALLAAMKEKFGIKPGETTPDGELSLLTARCVGSCGIAPVAVFDNDVVGNLAPERMARRAGKCCRHAA
ncbi:MAG: NAD(P)H-dependent oxidoreductase subunit E [Rhodospirillales bacterium]